MSQEIMHGNDNFIGMKRERKEFSKIVSKNVLTSSLSADGVSTCNNLKINGELTVSNININSGSLNFKGISNDDTINLNCQVNIGQSAYTEDHDVINIDKNTSFVDYSTLSRTFYTKIGGSNDETTFKNNRCVDKDGNLYIISETSSDFLSIFDSTNNKVPVADLNANSDTTEVFIVKYNHVGEYQWSTHIGGYYEKLYPSLICDASGNVIVCVSNFTEIESNVNIYDTTDNFDPVYQIPSSVDNNVVIVKYNKDGVFQWTVNIDGAEDVDPTLPRIACDLDENIYLTQTSQSSVINIYDKTPEEYVPLPDDFFCVELNHTHTGTIKYEQPIYSFNTNNNDNYINIKFNKDGMFKWINHLELERTPDYDAHSFNDTDSEGNLYVCGNFSTRIQIFNPLNKTAVPEKIFDPLDVEDTEDNLFIIKYNSSGEFLWITKFSVNNEDVRRCNLIVDYFGNTYVTCEVERATPCYIFDTTDENEPQVTIATKDDYRTLVLIKYDTNGVYKWYNYCESQSNDYNEEDSEELFTPCLAIDNRYVNNTDDSHVYLSSYNFGNVNFYNKDNTEYVAFNLPYESVYGNSNAFVSCYDVNGNFTWATKAASNLDVRDNSIAADKDGHVYFIGTYRDLLYIYDAQNSAEPITTLTKTNDDDDKDIFIIKYNRYGLLNIDSPRLLYIEDNVNIPDSFCKQIVLTNNDNGGIVNLQILKKENFGYSVRRTIVISDAIELVTKNGLWIPKIISDQYEHTNDFDIVDLNSKTSFIDYKNLQNTYYTRICGTSDDLRPQLGLDKDGNLYVAGVYQSSELNIFDYSSNNVPVGNLYRDAADQNLFLTKYNQAGKNLWRTRIGGYNAKKDPSIFVAYNGAVFVSMTSNDDGNIDIFDVNNVNEVAKSLTGYNYDNTILVKYNEKGEFQWNLRIKALNIPEESNDETSGAVVTGDMDGNIYMAGCYRGGAFEVYDTSDDDVPVETFQNADPSNDISYFIVKFDYTGKFIYANHLVGILDDADSFTNTDYFKQIKISISTDSYGSLYLTSTFNPINGDFPSVSIYNANDVLDAVETISTISKYNRSVMNIKYDKDGIFKWYNTILAVSDSEGVLETSNCVDADGNLYITFTNASNFIYRIFDTRTATDQPVYQYENTRFTDVFVSILKFNSNGIFQWNNLIDATTYEGGSSEFITSSVICCDNKYIRGQNESSIYLQTLGFLDSDRSFNFYHSDQLQNVAYKLDTKDYWMGDPSAHSIVSKYDLDGNFQWATTSVIYSYEGEDSTLSVCDIKADKKGQVYVSGSFDDDDLYIFDVSSNGFNDNEQFDVNDINGFDCYIIKYNRFGLLNNTNDPTIYLEDSNNIPNAYEKSVVITNNENNGVVYCELLEPLSSGYSFNIRKTVSIYDALDFVCNNGQWIPKISPEQISVSYDLDVIDPNTKTSFIDYNDLNDGSWATTIKGLGDEQNARVGTDKDSNLYIIGTYTSNPVEIRDLLTDDWETENRTGTRDIFIAKYNKLGNIRWTTSIHVNTDTYYAPSLFVNENGDSFITFVTTHEGGSYIITIMDPRGESKDITIDNKTTLTVKFSKDGSFLYYTRIVGINSNVGAERDSKAVSDKHGNLYVSGYYNSDGFNVYDSSEANVQSLNNENNGLFLVKFNKDGKYVWNTRISNGMNTEYKTSIVCDSDSNVILSGVYSTTVTVFNNVNNTEQEFTTISNDYGSLGIFIVKYDTTGKCIWTTKMNANNSGTTFRPTSCIDYQGNYYLAAEMEGENIYLFDTRNSTEIRFIFSIPSIGSNTILIKYNKNGIIQWYTFVSGLSGNPSVCVDNKYIKGINNNGVYLSGFSGDSITLYSGSSDGAYPSVYTTLTNIGNYDIYLIKFSNDGNFDWFSKVGGSDNETNSSIVATSDGHIYLAGEFNSETINVYQGNSLSMDGNTDVAVTLTNATFEEEVSSTYDIFLIKFNRYGVVNNGSYRFGREIYLENNADIPDGTEKTIVIANNIQYGNTNPTNIVLLILDYGYSYTISRSIWFCDGLTLISHAGRWILKSSGEAVLPKRSIIMWGGNQNDIPVGWRLCDGGSFNSVTTPDLRGRFILGFNDSASGVNGSSSNGGNTTTGTGARAHTALAGTVGTTGGEVLHTNTIFETATHNHGGVTGGGGYAPSGTDVAVSLTTKNVAEDEGSHTHSISDDGGGGAHNNIPPFYVLAFIMKCF